MADQTPRNPMSTPPSPEGQPSKVKKGKWGKRLLIGAAVLVVVLVILVLLIPTIAGMGFVRSIVVGKVNDNLNGKLAIDDWSLSWTSGIDVNGLSLTDAAGQKVLELRKLHTDLTLMNAVRGRYDLGKVTVDGLRANVVMGADGGNNLQKVTKPSGASPSANSNGNALPDVKADVVLTDCQATVSGAGVPEPVTAAFSGEVQIPDLNQTITDTLNTTLTIGSKSAGKVDISGSVNVLKNGAFDEKTASVGQKITIAGMELAGIAPLLPNTALATLQGVTDGELSLDLKNGSAGTLQGTITIHNVVAGGPAINGDTFQSDAVGIVIPTTTIAMSNGLADWKGYQVHTGGSTSSGIVLSLGKTSSGAEMGQLTLLVDAPLQAILNAAAGKAPGLDGKVQISDSLDIAALSKMMPKTMKLVDGVQVQSGKLTQQNTVTMTAQQGTLETVTDVSAITAVNTAQGNHPINIQPIHLDASAAAGGGGATDFRNVALNLKSGFATAAFKGSTLADISGNAHGDLKAAHDELGQVVDFGKLDLAGTFDMTVASTGNLAEDKGQGNINAQLTFANLRVTGLAEGKTIDQKWMNIGATATLVRGQEKFINAVNNANLTIKTGDQNNPTIDVVTVANVNLSGATPTVGFALQKCFVDAAKAQSEFSAFVPGDYKVTSGTLNAVAAGTWSNGTLQLQSLTATPTNLTVNLAGANGPSTPVVKDLTMNIAASGTLATAAGQQSVNLTKLDVTEQQKRLVLQKISDGPLVVAMGTGSFSGNGKLQVSADLAFVNGIVQAVTSGGKQVVAQGKAGDVKSGMLDGTLSFDSTGGKPTAVAGDFKVANLVVTTEIGSTQPQAIALTLQATAPADFSSVSAQEVSVKSAFANVSISDALLKLKDPATPAAMVSVWDKLQKANVTVDVPDVGQTYTIANAFLPATPSAPTTQPMAAVVKQKVQNAVNRGGPAVAQAISQAADAAGHPIPQATTAEQLTGSLAVSGGHASVKLTVARASGVTTVNLTDLSGGGIQLQRGSKSYAVQPFSMQAAATLKTNSDQISEMNVSQLTGKLGIADLSMQQPIEIKNLSGGGQMSATGTVQLAGKLEQASDLMQMLAGKPIPYTGGYTVVQKLSTDGATVNLAGNVDLTQFQVMDDSGKPEFNEDKVAITNDLKIDQKAMNLTGSLNVDSTVLGVKFNGGVNDFEASRKIVDGTTLALNYDAAKVWPLIKPMLSPEMQTQFSDLTVTGTKQVTFKMGGSYPANVPFEQAIANLTMSGAVPLDTLHTDGIDAKQINPGFTLAKGKFTITEISGAKSAPAAPPKPRKTGAKAAVAGTTPAATTARATTAPATSQPAIPMVTTMLVNGGTVDLTNSVIDLTTPTMTLSMPSNKMLAHNVALNPVLAKRLNKALPVFDESEQSALTEIKIVKCDQYPMGAAWTKASKTGYAEVVISLTNVKPGGPVIGGIDQFVGGVLGGNASASVQPTTIILSNGTAQIKDFVLAVGDNQHAVFKMNGTVGLADNGPLNLTANVPADLIKRLGKDVVTYLPNGIDLPIGGTKEKPEFAGADKVIASAAKEALTNAAKNALTGSKGDKGGLGGLLGNVLGQDQSGGTSPSDSGGAQPAQSKPDSLGGLLNSLSNKKKDKKAPSSQPSRKRR